MRTPMYNRYKLVETTRDGNTIFFVWDTMNEDRCTKYTTDKSIAEKWHGDLDQEWLIARIPESDFERKCAVGDQDLSVAAVPRWLSTPIRTG